VVRAYYAIQNTWFPAVFGTAAVMSSLPLYWYGLKFIGAGGIALAVTMSSVLQLVILYMLWNKRSRNSGSRAVYAFYLTTIALSGLLLIVLEWVKDLLQNQFDMTSLTGNLAVAGVVGAVFALVLMCFGRLAHVREIDGFFDRFRRKPRRPAAG
jgi:putative peptidoglycan lipid II flippase